MAKVTRKELNEALRGVVADGFGYSAKTGRWTFRRGFYYRCGGTAESFAAAVSAALRAKLKRYFSVVGKGEEWKAFRGGARLKDQSHWWVEVEFDEEEEEEADPESGPVGEGEREERQNDAWAARMRFTD